MSVDSNWNQATGSSYRNEISGDGRFVVFQSSAPDLVPGDSNGVDDVFLHEIATGLTTVVTVAADGNVAAAGGSFPQVSGDGRFVAFQSTSDDFGPTDTNGMLDVYVRDTVAGTNERISLAWDEQEVLFDSSVSSITEDGSRVVFSSVSGELTPGDANGVQDVFVRDRSSGLTTRVSVANDGAEGDANSFHGVVSGDGAIVAFESAASDLVAGDTNGEIDMFVRERRFDSATWSNYGSGLPGKLGIPSISLDAAPVLGTAPDLVVGNSAGTWTLALLAVGVDDANLPTHGGILLVDPLFFLTLAVAPGGSAASRTAIPATRRSRPTAASSRSCRRRRTSSASIPTPGGTSSCATSRRTRRSVSRGRRAGNSATIRRINRPSPPTAGSSHS